MIKLTDSNINPKDYSYEQWLWINAALDRTQPVLDGKAVHDLRKQYNNDFVLLVIMAILAAIIYIKVEDYRMELSALITIFGIYAVTHIYRMITLKSRYERFLGALPADTEIILDETGFSQFEANKRTVHVPWKDFQLCFIAEDFIAMKFENTKYRFVTKYSKEKEEQILEAFGTWGNVDLVKHLKVENGKMSLK
ncbi:MAG: hypothetical protein IKU09_10075 [Firmicutes bacterium]|nr:hypothetical protein [Bacillota bacterium]